MTRDVTPTGEIVVRTAVRLLLVTPDERVLLIHYITPDTDHDFWCTPGGALEGDESDQAAAQRELSEELGYDLAGRELGPVVATRNDVFVIGDGRTFHQDERFYLLRVDHFDPTPAGLSGFESLAVRGYRWWSIDQVRDTDDDVSPRRLAELLSILLADPPSGSPLAAG